MQPKTIIEVADLDGTHYPISIAEDLEINPTMLEVEFCNQPQRYRYYGELAEAAKDAAERKKIELGRMYAVIDERVRSKNHIDIIEAKQNARPVPPKLTEKMTENCVVTDPEYVELQREYLTLKKQAGILKVYQEAMQHRLQMLIGLGANYRAEGSADPTILRQAVKDRYQQRQHKEPDREPIRTEPKKKPVGKKPVGKKANRS
jgi:hypothetical protein